MRRLRSAFLAVALLLSAIAALPAASVAAALPAGTSKFVTATQVRLVETRASAGRFGFVRLGSNHIRVRVAGTRGVPANATAVVVNITAAGGATAGTIAAIPAGGTVTGQSNVVTESALISVANLTTVKLGVAGSIDLFHTPGMNMTIDLVGYYVPVTNAVAAGRLVLAQRPLTAMDRRRIGAKGDVVVNLAAGGVPASSSAAIVNVTVQDAAPGFVAAYAYGRSRPNASTLSISQRNQPRSNQTIVPVTSTNVKMRIYASDGATVTVEVIGWFTGASNQASTAGLFIPGTAHRRLITKTSPVKLAPFGPFTTEFTSGLGLPVAAVAANIVSAEAWDAERLVARPAGVPGSGVAVSTVGAPRLKVAAHALLRTSNRGVALTSASGAHLTVDVVGWYLGTPPRATSLPVKNRAIKPSRVVAVRWTELNPSTGRGITKTAAVVVPRSDNLDAAANSGGGAAYRSHSTLGAMGNVLVFGHRTAHGAVFNQLNNIPVGSGFSLKSANGHWYNYRVVGRHITPPTYRAIAAMATLWPPITAQLVACSTPDFGTGPGTTTKYRIVITGELISVN